MGRPRKSTAVLEMNGAFAKDPKRKKARAHEPPPNGPIGEAPRGFSDTLRDLWTEVVELVPPGVLAKSDRLIVESVCRLLEKLRDGDISGSQHSILTNSLAKLGLTPTDRSRVTVPGARDENGEEDLLAEFVRREGGGARPN